MSDVQCEYCGEYYDKRGIGAHQRHCEGAEADESTPEAGMSQLEAAVHERDNGRCVRCDTDADVVIHQIDTNTERQKPNLVTLCESCDSEVADLHPRTKRTKIQSNT